MKKLLLDTHIFLWWLFDDPKLQRGLRKHIADIENEVFVSSASVWEITTKFRLGKLPEAQLVAKKTPLWIEKAGFKSLSVTSDHAQLAGSWDMEHKDPFDRMLAAQAKIEKMVLVSVDEILVQFPVQVMDS